MSRKKNERQQPSVADRQMEQALAEAGGKETPPNRLDEIVRKAAADAAGPTPVSAGQGGRLWAAALVFLGLAATVTASLLQGDGAADPATNQQVQAGGGDGPVANRQGPQEQGPEKPKKNLPKGTDPEDLKVLRSAEKMLEAEKNLQEMIKKGRIAGVDQVLPFEQLESWQYTDGLQGMPEKVKALDGKKVLMLGFMLPIDEVQNIKEFLLVESLWSCCYGQPPDINGIVRCVMPKDKRLDYQFEPLKVVGKLGVEATMMDEYCVDIYQLHVDYLEVLDGASPDDKGPQKEAPQQKDPQQKGPQKKPSEAGDKSAPKQKAGK